MLMAEVRGVGVPENRQMEANWSIIGQRTGIAVFHPLHTARKATAVGLFSTACWQPEAGMADRQRVSDPEGCCGRRECLYRLLQFRSPAYNAGSVGTHRI